jgi:uncharacterized protein DUF6152
MRTRTKHPGRIAALMSLAAIWGTSLAHHSFAMFDDKKKVTLDGTITEFQWSNPHTYIEIDVSQKDGSAKHYTIECASISILRRMGWNREDLKRGDRAKVVFFPLRDGRPGGLMDAVTLTSGKVLGNANDQ